MPPVLFQETANGRRLAKVTEDNRKSSTSPKGKKDVDIEAATLMNALCKPWELGGHPHDFLVAHRSARITDSPHFYGKSRKSIQKHEGMLAEKEIWNRQRAIREEMLQLLTRLHSIEKERQHFLAVRQHNHDQYPDLPTQAHMTKHDHKHWHVHEHDPNVNTEVLSSSFVNDKISYKPQKFPSTRTHSHLRALYSHSSFQGRLKPVGQDEKHTKELNSPMIAAEKQEVQALDEFDLQLEALTKQKLLSSSSASFRNNKQR